MEPPGNALLGAPDHLIDWSKSTPPVASAAAPASPPVVTRADFPAMAQHIRELEDAIRFGAQKHAAQKSKLPSPAPRAREKNAYREVVAPAPVPLSAAESAALTEQRLDSQRLDELRAEIKDRAFGSGGVSVTTVNAARAIEDKYRRRLTPAEQHELAALERQHASGSKRMPAAAFARLEQLRLRG